MARGRMKTPAGPSAARGRKVIAYAMLRQEVNIFSPVPTTLEDFKEAVLLYGSEVLTDQKNVLKGFDECRGFLAAVRRVGGGAVEAVPIYKAFAMSGGAVEVSAYEHLKSELIRRLKQMEQLDGLYLALHGAMGVAGMDDPEGDLLRALRKEFGEALPIGVSFDLHANLTGTRVQLATFIVGYRTSPHRDHYRTGYTAGKILVQTIREEIQPVMAFRKLKLLKGGGMTIDFLPPMRSIFRWIKSSLHRKGVLSLSNFMVHLWIDEPEMGWSTVAVTDGNRALAEQLAEEMAELDWAVRDHRHHEGFSPSEAIALARRHGAARRLGTVMFCDASDAIGAGAPGENTWILKALLEEAPDLVSYVPLRDPEAVRTVYDLPLGEMVTLTVGGKLEQGFNRPLEVSGKVKAKKDWLYGKTVILKHGGVHLVLTEKPPITATPAFYRELGLSLWKADIAIAKNLFPFRFTFLLYNRKTIDVITPGTTNVNVFELGYKRIPRPIYPLDEIDDWR